MLSRGRGIRTGLLTLTRGEGGQNEIGPELFEALGLIRTGELMAIHRYDGAEQFFSRAYEFGYSYSVEETFEKWGKEEILSDVVRIIRRYRPDVIVTLPRFGEGGGQHHQASAQIALEAYHAAGDPSRFPEQIQEGLRPWQAKKIYERVGWGGGNPGTSGSVLSVDCGDYDPLLGATYQTVGLMARSMHRCQGMSQVPPLPRPYASRWHLIDSKVSATAPESDLFDGIETTLISLGSRLGSQTEQPEFLKAELDAIQKEIDQAVAAFNWSDPSQTGPHLARGLAKVRSLRQQVGSSEIGEEARYEADFILAQKERQFQEALRHAHQLKMQVIAADGKIVPGQTFDLTVNLINGGTSHLGVGELSVQTPEGWSVKPTSQVPESLPGGSITEVTFVVSAAANASITERYWHRFDPAVDRYELKDPEQFGQPWPDFPVRVRLHYRSGDVTASTEEAAQHRYEGPWVGGEQRHELMVVPKVSVTVDPAICIFSTNDSATEKEIKVSALYRGNEPTSARLSLELPAGWRSEPPSTSLQFEQEDQSVTTTFRVIPPKDLREGEYEIVATAEVDGQTYRTGHQIIDYQHIPQRLHYEPSLLAAKAFDVRVASGIKLGYIDGVGDQVPAALTQLGVDYTFLSEEDLASGDLDQFDVIMTGVRAYLNRQDLRDQNQRLLDWVRRGGVMIVQYNKYELNAVSSSGRPSDPSPFTPFPLTIGYGRVTDEKAPVELLEPEHPVFNVPNQIGPEDWANWVQERGLYFAGEKSPQYRDLISMRDPFEYNAGEKLGSLVVADYGEGQWIYLGLGLWRQLPAGVPGAYRLLANLISLPAAE